MTTNAKALSGSLALLVMSGTIVRADPPPRLEVIQHGIKTSVSVVYPSPLGDVLTVTFENLQDDDAQLAALSHRTMNGIQVVLSDQAGQSCVAEANPPGIAEVRNPISGSPLQTSALSPLPGHSIVQITLRFADCRVSHGRIALAGDFAVARGGKPLVMPVVLWGIPIGSDPN